MEWKRQIMLVKIKDVYLKTQSPRSLETITERKISGG